MEGKFALIALFKEVGVSSRHVPLTRLSGDHRLCIHGHSCYGDTLRNRGAGLV